MKKVLVAVTAVTLCLFGFSGAASATGGGHYPVQKPTVCASSGVVRHDKTFTVTAKDFCPRTAITITLTNGKNTYTKYTTTNRFGSATVTFDAKRIKPGTYKIIAKQNTRTCKKVAYSTVKILGSSGRLIGDGSDDAGAVFAALDAGMKANAQAFATASAVDQLSIGTPGDSGSSDSNGLSVLQLGAVGLASAIGLAEVARRRNRPTRHPALV